MPKNSPGPSVKDAKVYEALRDQGNAKEKSARIANAAANTSRTTIGQRGGSAPPYEQWTVVDLRKRAAQVGVGGRSSMSKQELINALRDR